MFFLISSNSSHLTLFSVLHSSFQMKKGWHVAVRPATFPEVRCPVTAQPQEAHRPEAPTALEGLAQLRNMMRYKSMSVTDICSAAKTNFRLEVSAVMLKDATETSA